MEEQKTIKTLFVDCNDARDICNRAQYKEASSWDIFKLRFHNLFCKICNAHSIKNAKLTSLCSSANLKTMDKQMKTDMKKNLETALKNTKE
uniref:hypothetical protein n=1 Tax=Ascidiimonas aurantiaca TaxID=1685432 RepID=UPI0030EC70A6